MNRLNKISNELSEFIIENYEEKILRDIISVSHGYLLPYEQEEVYKISLKNKPMCKSLIAEKLKEYLETSNTVILDGFVNFRLREYKHVLTTAINNSVKEFELRREYDVFINFLKNYVEDQVSVFDIINLLGTKSGNAIILNESEHTISEELNGDMLLDTILTIAPKKINLHNIGLLKNDELINTIMNVFVGKIVICNGCSICGKIH